MSAGTADKDTTDVQRGAQVAKDLGWPSERMGFLGAVAGLADVAAPPWERRSAFARVLHRRRRADQMIMRRMHGKYGERVSRRSSRPR